MSSSTTPQLSPAERHRRSQLYARLTYAGIIVVFVSICATAVLLTMQRESHKEGFKAIELNKPISFFDYTYVRKEQKP